MSDRKIAGVTVFELFGAALLVAAVLGQRASSAVMALLVFASAAGTRARAWDPSRRDRARVAELVITGVLVGAACGAGLATRNIQWLMPAFWGSFVLVLGWFEWSDKQRAADPGQGLPTSASSA